MSSALNCYVGVGSNYEPSECAQCLFGIDCMCMKVPEQGNIPETRGCWANPHGVFQEGCQDGVFFQQGMVRMCKCNGDLCNSTNQLYFNVAMLPALLLFKLICS